VQDGMSALPPKADMCSATRAVRFGPEADIRGPVITLIHRKDAITEAEVLLQSIVNIHSN